MLVDVVCQPCSNDLSQINAHFPMLLFLDFKLPQLLTIGKGSIEALILQVAASILDGVHTRRTML